MARTTGLEFYSTQLRDEAVLRLKEGPQAAATWLLDALERAADGSVEAWVFEAAANHVSAAVCEAGLPELYSRLEQAFTQLEAASLKRAREENGAALDALGAFVGALMGADLPDADPESAVESASVSKGGDAITIRPPERSERARFRRVMADLLARDYPSGPEGSYRIFKDEADNDVHYLMILAGQDIVGGSAVSTADNHYTEMSPLIVQPAYQTAGLSSMVTLVHCVQQSFNDPTPDQVYWSAVPADDRPRVDVLRHCGFAQRDDLWIKLAGRRAPTIDDTTWFAAPAKSLATRLLEALDPGHGRPYSGKDHLNIQLVSGVSSPLTEVASIATEVRTQTAGS